MADLLYYYLQYKFGKILYGTDSGAWVAKYLFGKIGGVVALATSLFHLQENSVGILICVISFLFFLLFFRYAMIVVFKDRFVYIAGLSSLFKAFREFPYKHLKAAASPVDYDVSETSKKQRVLNKVDSRKKIHLFSKTVPTN